MPKNEIPPEFVASVAELENTIVDHIRPLKEKFFEAYDGEDTELVLKASDALDNALDQYWKQVLDLMVKGFSYAVKTDKWRAVQPEDGPEPASVAYACALSETYTLLIQLTRRPEEYNDGTPFLHENWDICLRGKKIEGAGNPFRNYTLHVNQDKAKSNPEKFFVLPDMLSDQQIWALGTAIRAFKQKHHL